MNRVRQCRHSTLLHPCINAQWISSYPFSCVDFESRKRFDNRALTQEEQEYESTFAHSHSRDNEGQYVVRLSVSPSLSDLSTIQGAAIRMLFHMRRFDRDASLEEMFKKCSLHARVRVIKIHDTSRVGKDQICYLPHHRVEEGEHHEVESSV